MPKEILVALAASLTVTALAPQARAQPLELPRPSPFAKVSQFVGLTEITVDYSSPGVKGRKIWGELLAYDQLWRAGANSATKVTFTKDVVVADKPVAAGSYSLFMIPSKANWTVILNKNEKASTNEYKQDLDVVRASVKPQPIAHRERLAYLISDFTDDKASIDMEWEKVKVSLPIKVKTEEQALANIKAVDAQAWRPYNSAARYMLETKKDYEQALVLANKSIAVKEDWQNLWTKAAVLAAKGQHKEAYALAEKVKALGEKSNGFFAADDVNKALTEWKKKSGS